MLVRSAYFCGMRQQQKPAVVIILLIGALVGSWYSSSRAQSPYEKIVVTERSTFFSAKARSADGGMVFCGYDRNSFRSQLIKLDKFGAIEWVSDILDSTGDSIIVLTSIAVDTDNSIIAAGICVANANDFKKEPFVPATLVLIRFSPDGIIRWSKHFLSSKEATFGSVTILHDGSLFLCAREESGANYFIHTDRNAAILWIYGGSHAYPPFGLKVLQPDDSTILLYNCPVSSPPPSGSSATLFLQRLTLSGKSDPLQVYEKDRSVIQPTAIFPMPDASLLVVGNTVAADISTPNIAMVKISADGSIAWARNYNSLGGSTSLLDVYLDSSSILTAIVSSPANSNSLQLWRIDTAGVLKSVWSLGGLSSLTAMCYPLSDTGIGVITSVTDQHSNYGQELAAVTASGLGCNLSPQLGISQEMTLSHRAEQFSLFKINTAQTDSLPIYSFHLPISTEVICLQDGVPQATAKAPLFLFPNPAPTNSYITISLPAEAGHMIEIVLHDLTGREVYRTHLEDVTSSKQIQIPTVGLASGVYTVELVDASSFTNVWRGKVVVE